MTEAVLGLGTNLGDRVYNMDEAVKAIKNLSETKVLDISHMYETIPFGVPDKQENYLNCCLKIRTDLEPKVLLKSCLKIEAELGRVRSYKNAPRIIDIDLLLYGDVIFSDNELTLPHPRILERAFVMFPLRDIYPNCVALGVDFSKHLESIDENLVKGRVEK